MNIKEYSDKIDTQEEMNKCLECKKKECTNCLYYTQIAKSKSEILKERNEIIMEMFHFGANGSQIAKRLKMNQSTVNSIIRAYGGRKRK